MGRIRYCEQCGSPLAEGIRFCENCGADLTLQSSFAGKPPLTPGNRNRSQDTQKRRSQKSGGNRGEVPRRAYDRGREAISRRPYGGSREEVPRGAYDRSREDISRRPYSGNRGDMPREMYSRNREGVPITAADRKSRYRQEELENNWQQSWDRMPREEEEQRITPLQYVLIGLTVLLLVALIILGVYWILGRSSDKSTDNRNSGQNSTVEKSGLKNEDEPVVTILNENDNQPSDSVQTEKGNPVQIPVQTETGTINQVSPQSETQAETQPAPVIEVQEQPSVSSGGYLSESSDRLLTDSDVSGMSYDDMQMAINEIYARHGRKFSDPNIQNYFNSQSWYQGIIEPDEFSESVFSSTEGQNIQFLLNKMGVQ